VEIIERASSIGEQLCENQYFSLCEATRKCYNAKNALIMEEKMKIKTLFIAVLFTMYAVFMAGCSSQSSSPTRVIAEVNGEKITQSQLDERINLIKGHLEMQNNVKLDPEQDKEIMENIKESAYQNLISITLMEQEAKKQGVTVDDQAIDSQLEQFKQLLNQVEPDGFNNYLQALNINEEQLWNQLKSEELFAAMQKRVVGDISISDAEIEKYYADNIDQFTNPGGIRIYHIVVETEEKANEVLYKLQQGENFADLARQYSMDGTKSTGGDLGVVNEQTNFVEEFKKAALALKPGEITPQPVKTEYGFHIIKAGDRQEPRVSPLSDVASTIKSQLEMEKQEELFNQFIDSLINNADIKDYRNA